jgi:hypothetical protein
MAAQLLLLFMATPLQANADYRPSLPHLSGTARDASRVQKSLSLVDFDVRFTLNLGKDAFKDEVSRFVAHLQQAARRRSGSSTLPATVRHPASAARTTSFPSMRTCAPAPSCPCRPCP